jgi:hypothetical protein
MSVDLPFVLLAPGVGVGQPAPSTWQSIQQASLLIVVGVTGVGKSTTLGKLAELRLPYSLLPNRRELTDRLIIAAMQADEGLAVRSVTDRRQRFDYTRRYREKYPGGMSHALAQLQIEPSLTAQTQLFDGLRGVDEVAHAVAVLPKAKFVVLHAPDAERVRRLLARNDAFDQTSATPAVVAVSSQDFASLGLLEARDIFTAEDEAALCALVAQGQASADDLRAKVQIVLEERRNYDPLAAIELLTSCAPKRTLVIDTTKGSPDEVADTLVQQFRVWGLVI